MRGRVARAYGAYDFPEESAASWPARGRRYLRGLLCGLVAVALVAGAAAQKFPPEKKQRKSARAVALIEWHADAHGVAAPRLLPISFLWEGKYYDAGLYQATPRPLALEPGTVYEAFRSGVPAGLYTVRGATEVKGTWYGDGIWNPGATAVASTESEDEGPPRLRRPKPGGESAPTETTAGGRDTGGSPASTQPPPEPDADRPILHRGKPSANEARAGESPAPTNAKGAPPKSAQASGSPASAQAPAGTGESPVPTKSAEMLVAVSDEHATEIRSYLFQWGNRDEEERLTGGMKSLAEEAVAREAGAKPALDQVRVRAFDLNLDNEPELVLTARTVAGGASPKGLRGRARVYYVTVVARVTISGDLHQLFASVTADSWLGSVPRMELVDAVDADGDGRGDLLFELLTTGGRSFALYRVGRDDLLQLVEAGPFPNP